MNTLSTASLDEARKRHRKVANPFQILCLSGGGFRGLFSICVLEELEQRAGVPLRDCFDLVAGTSIGGIVACGLVAGVAASDIRQRFEEAGGGIFTGKGAGIFSAKHPVLRLRAIVEEVLGEQSGVTLRTLNRPLIVPAVDASNGRPVVFRSGESAGSDRDVALLDVALATSAAPTYFPDHPIGNRAHIDGGVIANAPDLLAIGDALSRFGERIENVRMLSIGTAGHHDAELFRGSRRTGKLGWVLPRKLGGRDLFGLTIGAQEILAVTTAVSLLGQRHIRIDSVPDAAQAPRIGLDVTGKDAVTILSTLARNAIEEADRTRGGDLAAILRHRSSQLKA